MEKNGYREFNCLKINRELKAKGGFFEFKKERGMDKEYYCHRLEGNRNIIFRREYRWYPVEKLVILRYNDYYDGYIDIQATQKYLKHEIKDFIGGDRFIIDIQQSSSRKSDKIFVSFDIYFTGIERLSTEYEVKRLIKMLKNPVY